MGRSTGNFNMEDIPFEKINEFYLWLQGKGCPEGFSFEEKMSLTDKQAFGVIYYLQECLELMPDNIERCIACGDLFDFYEEGTSIDNESETKDGKPFPESMYGLYCDTCRPD